MVNVQGFKSSADSFVFKELVVVAVEEDALLSIYLFDSPYKWSYLKRKEKSENRWLERNYHVLAWSAGDIPYDDLLETLI